MLPPPTPTIIRVRVRVRGIEPGTIIVVVQWCVCL